MQKDKDESLFFDYMKRKVKIDRGRTLVLATMRTICAERALSVEVPDTFDFDGAIEAIRLNFGWAETKLGHDFQSFMAVWGVPSEGSISPVLVVALAHQMMERFPSEMEVTVNQWALAWGATFARQWQRYTLKGANADKTQGALFEMPAARLPRLTGLESGAPA